LCSLVLVTCEDPPPQEDVQLNSVPPVYIEFDTERFNREWAAWEAQGITDYSVEEDVLISGKRREIARIVVQDNAIIQNETLDRWDMVNVEDHPYSARGLLNEVRTISEIYVWVNRVYEEAVALYTDSKGRYGIRIGITYNEEFHYPEFLYMDSNWAGPVSCDLCLSEFIPLVLETED